MSYGEELSTEAMIDEAVLMIKASNGTWTTKEGEVLNICEMSTQHIVNTLNMLRGKKNPSEFTESYIVQFEKELQERARIILVLKELGLIT